MRFNKLIEMQKNGLFRVREVSNGGVEIANNFVTCEQCHKLLKVIGWRHYEESYIDTLLFTNKLIRNLKRHINKKEIINNTELNFLSRRIENTMKYFYRVQFTCIPDLFDLSVIINMPGCKGKYTVYDLTSNSRVPIAYLNSYKALGDHINNLV